ncbi:MAG: LLM class F420-dependent oxidoreductase [Caulobacterales bacterium]
MKIGISTPNNWGVEDVSALIDLAVRADERGFASVWTSEHLINLAYVRARIGERPYFHPLAILSAIAARTTKIALGTSVIVMPFHNPFDLAKYIATLDQISQGRVILGVGVGNVKEEFDVLGASWEARGAVTDESIQVLRALWSQREASHQGRLWSFSGVFTSPKPYNNRSIPIWVGGMSAPARRRVVSLGDGWHPTAVSPDEVRAQIGELHALCAAQGRDPAAIEICMRFNIALDGAEVTETELRSTINGLDKKRVVEVAKSFADAGVTHFIYALNGRERQTLLSAVDFLSGELLPHFS